MSHPFWFPWAQAPCISSFFFACPSFIEGIARIFDFGNTLQEYNTTLTPQQADVLALQADMNVVAGDMWQAFMYGVAEVNREQAKSQENTQDGQEEGSEDPQHSRARVYVSTAGS